MDLKFDKRSMMYVLLVTWVNLGLGAIVIIIGVVLSSKMLVRFML